MIQIKHDLEQLRKIYKAYFNYERKREFAKIPWIGIVVVSGLLLGIGVLTQVHFLFYIGLFTIGLLSIYLIYFLLRFKRVEIATLSDLGKNIKVHGAEFQFYFGEDGIRYITLSSSQYFTWDIIKSYEENEGDIYLFRDNSELFDIISASIIGNETLEKFRLMLIKKLNSAYNEQSSTISR